ncbi:MAG: hypothetical protein Q6363_001350 [Candidatus Njordarchaeota archaeon]
MVAKLFLSFKNRAYYYLVSRLGFAINCHIKYPPQGLKVTPLLVSANRLVIEITKKDENLEKWLDAVIRKTSYHGVETYIIAEEKVLDLVEVFATKDVKIIPQGTNIVGKYEIVAVDLKDVSNIDHSLYLLGDIDILDNTIIDVASRKNVWGISGCVDFILESKQVLFYNRKEKKFELVEMEEFIEKNIGQVIDHFKYASGFESLMLNEIFRFLYEAKHGDDTDIEDARIGLSVINLYVFFDI